MDTIDTDKTKVLVSDMDMLDTTVCDVHCDICGRHVDGCSAYHRLTGWRFCKECFNLATTIGL